MIFTKIEKVELPETASINKGFTVVMVADGEVPFAQLIVRHNDGWEWIVKEQYVTDEGKGSYCFQVPPEAYHAGTVYLQIEGCRVADIYAAQPDDWIKRHCELQIVGGTAASIPKPVQPQQFSQPSITLGETDQPVIYFGIHKHQHQPYYNAADVDYWDGEKDDIFGQRGGPYTHFIPAAVRQYIDGGLAHAGLSTSWSGSLIEQLHRCGETGQGHGAFGNWNQALRELAGAKTALGNPRVDFTAFGFFHPLMALIPARDIVGQIEWHRRIIRDTFDTEASDVMFPPETAFHPHMIPALKQAGVNAIIYDSIHHFRACQDYPYGGQNEGMLPPNPAEQENPPVNDWLQLQCIWAASKISPQLLKPCILYYTDHEGQRHEIIGVPAERYLGNEDARGGYGALQYENVMGQIYDQICQTNTFDPKHPPFFVLHSDGDNYGGGAESYYTCNTGGLVNMCQTNPRFQLITVKDYLQRFPVDPKNTVHVEPGSWAGADNGDPQFTKWFSWLEKDYSPDLNSWAVLTAFQNVVYSLEDAGRDPNLIEAMKRLLYTAETSCYWYWTGQNVWDAQVTNAVNKGMDMARGAIDNLLKSKQDKTGPTIFVPWVRPANPGGKDWGQGGLVDAAPQATFHTLIHDLSGLKKVTLLYQKGDVQGNLALPMEDCGAYPSRTNPSIVATQYKAVLPAGTGNIRYFVEAVDTRDNVSYSPVGRISIA
ncbi:MAG: glycosyl hydrolase family 57 [Candidatus Parabeggiatoa sp. nov. 1]|nr:MAG: glycosyl hydrolase family 57 [Gammaproteobacteria bacterium]